MRSLWIYCDFMTIISNLSPDNINGIYEALGGVMLWRNVYQLYKDKQVKGISILSTSFFASWGAWNLFYYKHLNQPFSWYGGMVIVSANVVWVSQMLFYSRRNKQVKNGI